MTLETLKLLGMTITGIGLIAFGATILWDYMEEYNDREVVNSILGVVLILVGIILAFAFFW